MLAAPSWAADYYVRQGEYLAKDGSNCANSISIATFNSSASGGNTYVICSGETITTTIAPPTGTEGSVITLISEYEYDTTGTQYDVVVATGSYGANLSSKDYITIDGLYFNNCGSRWILMNYSDHNIIQNCKFYDSAAYAGILMDYSDYNQFIDNEFPDAPASGTGCVGRATNPADAINWYNGGSYNLFQGNTFGRTDHTSIGQYSPTGGYNVYRGNTNANQYHTGLNIAYGTTPNLVDGNYFYDQGLDMANDPCPTTGEGNNGFQNSRNAYYLIMRRNIFDNNNKGFASGGSSGGSISYEHIYNNTFNGGVSPFFGRVWDIGYTINNSKIKNNIFTGAADCADWAGGCPSSYIPSNDLGYNLYYDVNGGTGNEFYNNNAYGGTATGGYRYDNTTEATFAELISAIGSPVFPAGHGNISADPKYTSIVGRDFTLQADSDMIDAGAWLTTITSATATTDTITVADGGYFYDGWGITGETGDVIRTAAGVEATIDSVTGNTIVFTAAISVVNGEGIALDYAGTAPDIGAEERGTSVSITGPSSSQDCADDSDPYDATQEVTMTVDSSTNATCKYDTASTDPCSTATYAGLANTFTDTTAQTTHTTPITSSCDTSIPYSVICIDDVTSLPSNCLTVTVTVAPGGDIAGLRIDTGGTVSITTGGTVSIE